MDLIRWPISRLLLFVLIGISSLEVSSFAHRADAAPPEKSAGDKDGDKANEDGKDGEGDDKEDPPPKVIRRDQLDDREASKLELTAAVGDDGMVSFQFRNQSWVELVEWLADISDQPIDWLELPGDKVNLRSPGRYTVVETQDLFNRHLLSRGYTLLEVDGGLTIVKTKSLNPAIVPRVSEDKLRSLPAYTFVRTSLDAGWLSAEKLAEEFKAMISPGGRLTALATTNQIEAMDAAINLREIAQLIAVQRSQTTRDTLAPEFTLRHIPAEQAKTMLEQFLGIEKKKTPTLTPEQIQQMQRRNGGNEKPPAAPKAPEISVVANVRQNSLLIRAPNDRVAVAMEFLKRVDVPSNNMASLADVKDRVQVFRLSSLDPEKLIEIITEMNILEPDTRIRTDKDNKAVIVSGGAADRYIIESLIQRLDGSGRTFEVLPLRRLDPSEVAESISFLMGQKDDDDKKSNSRRSYYSYYSRGNDKEEKDEDQFRVAANERFKQIMLWANEQEMNQVRSLLVKLGELPPPGGNTQRVRIIEAAATPETLEYLKRLKAQWQQMAGNELELPDESEFVDPNDADQPSSTDDDSEGKDDGEATPAKNDAPAPKDADDQQLTALQNLTGLPGEETGATTNGSSNETIAAGDDAEQPFEDQRIHSSKDFDRRFGTGTNEEPESKNNLKQGGADSPISIAIDADGNLVLSSKDTEALDRLESLMLQIEPPKRPYRVFYIKYATAFWMRSHLETYFKDNEDSGKSDSDSFFSWYWGTDDDEDDDKPSGLGKDAKMKFVDDSDTNTIVVSGATPSQLKTIAELIALWDIVEPVNKQRARFTKLTTINYGKADTIAETVKEAYRDLLSSNDKTFQRGGNGGDGDGGGKKEPKKSRNSSSGSSFESDRESGGDADFTFKGKLSLGVDPIGNTILVSAEGESLLDLVIDMIEQLDEAAQPQGEIAVIEVGGGVSGASIEEALKAMGSTSTKSTSSGSNGSPKSKSRRNRE